MVMISTSSVPLSPLNPIALYQFSPIQTSLWQYGHITNTGIFIRELTTYGPYLLLSGTNLFSSLRQVKKTARDGTEEIWHEKTYLTTERKFPTVLRRSEVVGMEIVEISPLENALNEVQSKTKELTSLYQKYQALAKTAQHVSTNALAMSLNSAVDAPLNIGISSYRQTFFNPDYLARNPERAELVGKLRLAIDEQVNINILILSFSV